MTRVAVVTGAGRGIGAGIAARLAADGMRVVGVDRAPGTELTLDVTDRAAVLEALGALVQPDAATERRLLERRIRQLECVERLQAVVEQQLEAETA